MGKIRVNKLALELNISNDQIIDELRKHDYAVKNHMSSIDAEMAQRLRDSFSTPAQGKKKILTKATAKATAKKKAAPKATAKKKPIGAKDEEKVATRPKIGAQVVAKAAAKKKAATEADAAKKIAAKATIKKKPPVTETQVKKAEEKPKVVKKLGLKIVKKEEPDKTVKPKEAKPKAVIKEKKKEAKPAAKPVAETPPPPPEPVQEEQFEIVQIPEVLGVRELSELLKCTPNDIIKDLMGLGIMSTINQSLTADIASKVADQRGFEVELISTQIDMDFEEEEEDRKEDWILRPPIVTIMGHVDHGKTSLLDAIRKTNITEGEKGGITQHIGAYQTRIKGSAITFLDTPGHEAFTAMRARGAQITDLVVLVVAADDGIKPQTKEAIDHAGAANVQLVVAINKIDKPGAKPEEVKKQLAEHGLLPEDWGGQTIFTEVSALEGTGIDDLLEMLLLQAEILELKGNPKIRAKGVVIESHLDKGRGPVATVMVQHGLLRVGDPFIVGNFFGKVRALNNDQGKSISKASLSTPVEVVGIPEVPSPGDQFMVVQDERRARQFSESRIHQQRVTALALNPRITMEDLHQQILAGKVHDLNLIIKADVQGSIQAVKEALSKLETEQVRIKSIHDAVGGITESDVLLASASNAIIIGFNVRPGDKVTALAAHEKVDVRLYGVIYDAINDIQKAMDGLLEPTFEEKVMGRAEVREVFTIPKIGTIAGCHVLSGLIERNRQARLVRDDVVVYEGKISSLKRFKDDVKEVASGYECGLSFEKYQDLKQGDIVEPYVMEELAP